MKKTAYDIVENRDLTGKAFLITGGYAGLGAISTEAILKAKGTVIVAGRSADAQSAFAKSLLDKPELNFDANQLDTTHTLDLGDLSSVRDFVQEIKTQYPRIDCLMNNAGVMNTPAGKTKDGFETQMGINVIGHFLLSRLLADITKRQVWLSSKGHIRYGAPNINYDLITNIEDQTYIPRWRYQQSKLGNILLAKEFARRYPHMTTYSVHPGGVKTNLGRHMTLGQKLKYIIQNPFIIMSMVEPEVGAATQVMVAVAPDDELTSGAYYADCKVIATAPSGENMAEAQKLFDYCEEVTAKFQ